VDVALDVFDVFAILAPQTRASTASGVSVWLGRSASAASKRSSVGAKLIWLTAARHAPLSQINHEAPSDHRGGVTLGWGTLAAGGQLSKAKGFTTAGSTELRSGRLFRAERAAAASAASAASKRAGCECGGLILGIHGQHNHSYLWRLRPDDARRFDAVQLRHARVHQYDIRPAFFHLADGLKPVCGIVLHITIRGNLIASNALKLWRVRV
jgi:hypothetical protein